MVIKELFVIGLSGYGIMGNDFLVLCMCEVKGFDYGLAYYKCVYC